MTFFFDFRCFASSLSLAHSSSSMINRTQAENEVFFPFLFFHITKMRKKSSQQQQKEKDEGGMLLINVSFAHWCTLHILHMRLNRANWEPEMKKTREGDGQILISSWGWLDVSKVEIGSILAFPLSFTKICLGVRSWRNWSYLSCIYNLRVFLIRTGTGGFFSYSSLKHVYFLTWWNFPYGWLTQWEIEWRKKEEEKSSICCWPNSYNAVICMQIEDLQYE